MTKFLQYVLFLFDLEMFLDDIKIHWSSQSGKAGEGKRSSPTEWDLSGGGLFCQRWAFFLIIQPQFEAAQKTIIIISELEFSAHV